jgi:hypothetical protein
MRIMQRPQGKSKFKGEDGKLDKKQLNEFMKKTFIENIWCFSKSKIDLFQETTLDKFFE